MVCERFNEALSYEMLDAKVNVRFPCSKYRDWLFSIECIFYNNNNPTNKLAFPYSSFARFSLMYIDLLVLQYPI